MIKEHLVDSSRGRSGHAFGGVADLQNVDISLMEFTDI